MITIVGHRGRIGACVSHILGDGNYQGVELGEQRPTSLPLGSVVFSTCPFTANLEVAKWARENNQHYADLGGDPETSAAIKELYKDSDLSCITDLGLAPGLVNIIAEHRIELLEKPPFNVEMFCGGLPYNNNLPNSLKYAITWSEKGLWNEYTGKCEILNDGEIIEVDALMPNPRVINIDSIRYESATTKGGIADSLVRFQELGVQNAAYFTLRYLGHYSYLSFLLKECKLSESEFVDIIQRVCPKTTQDVVLIVVIIDDDSCVMQFKHSDKFTAMQIATALPASIIVQMIAEGKKINSYKDIDKDLFCNKIHTIGEILFPGLIYHQI